MKKWSILFVFMALSSFRTHAVYHEDTLIEVEIGQAQKTPLIHTAIILRQLEEVKKIIGYSKKNLEFLHNGISPIMSALRLASFAHGTTGQKILEDIALELWKKGANINATLMKGPKIISLLEYGSNDHVSYREYLVKFFERHQISLEKDNLAYYRKYHPQYDPPEDKPVGPGGD